MISKLLNQALASLNYLLVLAVSVIAVIIAVVAFRSIVDDPEVLPAATTTSTAPATTSPVITRPVSSIVAESANCVREAPPSNEATRILKLFYECGSTGEIAPATYVYRSIDLGGGLLTRTMQELVAGPAAEEYDDGFRSLFSTATAGALISVTRQEESVTVDLRDLGPMPSLTVGSDGPAFLASLNNTIFQHQDVNVIEYRIEGSCDGFWVYFDQTECRLVDRPTWERNPASAG